MPILIIRAWEVSIRPCEFDNFARLFGQATRVQSSHAEYRNLMQYLTMTRSSLLDLVDMTDASYAQIRSLGARRIAARGADLPCARPGPAAHPREPPRVARAAVPAASDAQPGHQGPVRPRTVQPAVGPAASCTAAARSTRCRSARRRVGTTRASRTSLRASMRPGREHELLARRVRNNVEQHGAIYTPAAEFEDLGDVDELIADYNRLLPPTDRHAPGSSRTTNGHVFIVGYEDDTVAIIEKLQEVAGEGLDGHADDVQEWLDANLGHRRRPSKADALKALFEQSNVALVYGAAGTGKSTMVNHIANYFSDKSKLFLAHTNPAVDNLKRRVDAPNTDFSTITSHIYRARTSARGTTCWSSTSAAPSTTRTC